MFHHATQRSASVAADENGTYLLLPGDLDHVGIFAPTESLRQDDAQSWMVSLGLEYTRTPVISC